jgi:hypothetical protein
MGSTPVVLHEGIKTRPSLARRSPSGGGRVPKCPQATPYHLGNRHEPRRVDQGTARNEHPDIPPFCQLKATGNGIGGKEGPQRFHPKRNLLIFLIMMLIAFLWRGQCGKRIALSRRSPRVWEGCGPEGRSARGVSCGPDGRAELVPRSGIQREIQQAFHARVLAPGVGVNLPGAVWPPLSPGQSAAIAHVVVEVMITNLGRGPLGCVVLSLCDGAGDPLQDPGEVVGEAYS